MFELGDWLTKDEVKGIIRMETAEQFHNLNSVTSSATSKIKRLEGELAAKVSRQEAEKVLQEFENLRVELQTLQERLDSLDVTAAFTQELNKQLGQETKALSRHEELAKNTEERLKQLQDENKQLKEENERQRQEFSEIKEKFQRHLSLPWWKHLLHGLIHPH